MSEVDIDKLSLDELHKLEDELHEAEAAPEVEPDTDNIVSAEDLRKDSAGSGKPDSDAAPDITKGDKETDEVAVDVPDQEKIAAEVEKHVSPPQKWIAQRQKAKLEQQKSDQQQQSDALIERVTALTEQVNTLNSKVSKTEDPLEILSDENINDVREEHGDKVADMILALKASITKEYSEKIPGTKEDANTASVEAEMTKYQEALQENDFLAYWIDNDKELLDRAVNVEAAALKDPEYLKKSYPERADYIVDEVKKQVLAEKLPGAKEKKDEGKEPPTTLSGTDGSAPTQKNNSASQEILDLASSDTEAAFKRYDSLPDGPEKLKLEEQLGL